jgi:hypothetical protein
LINTDFKELLGEELLQSGIDKALFEKINIFKKSLIKILLENKYSEENFMKSIKNLIDKFFQDYTKSIIEILKTA